VINKEVYLRLKKELDQHHVTLVAVSKTKPAEDIKALYDLGQRDFGENYVRELVGKQKQLPDDIRWHFIGHLQTNKVKMLLPGVQLIHSVDSLKVLIEINKQSEKLNLVTNCLLQVHIAEEETKFGLDGTELAELVEAAGELKNVKILGLMGMASLTDNMEKIGKEFDHLAGLFKSYSNFKILSMGMTADYQIALSKGSTMVRIGSLLFGERS
jgi:PLP dependent protein